MHQKTRVTVQHPDSIPLNRAGMRRPHNLVIDVWLRELADVHTFEAHLSRRLPRLTVGDRSVVLRTVKHMGRLLDHDGRCVGVVPLRNPHGPEPSTSGPDLSVG
ncbi:hypothetical protein [Streptomyces flaveus]|uniref:hypothetical protein n=1 Tax=Streptomyces flaveus TaxID=66370 RepID=UPI00331A8614